MPSSSRVGVPAHVFPLTRSLPLPTVPITTPSRATQRSWDRARVRVFPTRCYKKLQPATLFQFTPRPPRLRGSLPPPVPRVPNFQTNPIPPVWPPPGHATKCDRMRHLSQNAFFHPPIFTPLVCQPSQN